ncbi:MAG: MFS transporter [Anaerolineae bacterium]|nr:MFS transporter [Anaerolineae bacterium]
MTHHRRRPSRLGLFILTLLLIECLDEFVYGAREAAWPLLRADLGLSYAQIGMLLGVPAMVSSVVEPFLGVLGDAWKRRALVLGGGVLFCLSLLLTSVSDSFALLLLSFILFYPASGAFVSLSQATLMDVDPGRHEQNMARWTLAGSVGVVAGPLALGAAVALGMGWRVLFAGFATLALLLLLLASRFRFANGCTEEAVDLKVAFAGVWRALKRGAVLRWLVLLQFSDLMLDVLLGYLALYFVDVVGVTAGQAATAVAVWTGVGLLGDVLLIPLLERVPGLRYLRLSAAVKLVLFPAFLLVPAFGVKLALLGLLGLFNAGWYSILKAQLYSTMPGQSGTTMAADNIFGFVGALIPWGLGVIAGRFGLQATMWLLLLGPLALLIGLPAPGTGAVSEV